MGDIVKGTLQTFSSYIPFFGEDSTSSPEDDLGVELRKFDIFKAIRIGIKNQRKRNCLNVDQLETLKEGLI